MEPDSILSAVEHQAQLIDEFRWQTAHLGLDRQFAILGSFIGNERLKDCVRLQQGQDGANPPKYWQETETKP